MDSPLTILIILPSPCAMFAALFIPPAILDIPLPPLPDNGDCSGEFIYCCNCYICGLTNLLYVSVYPKAPNFNYCGL
nr:MAG TPA: hypothetical protein [Caudoviricetes sp.]